jgi:hypothetical protein
VVQGCFPAKKEEPDKARLKETIWDCLRLDLDQLVVEEVFDGFNVRGDVLLPAEVVFAVLL